MGNDENTIKVSQRAEELGVEPKPYVDDMARQFQEVWAALEISFDDFIQTSEARHHVGCQKFIQTVYDAGRHLQEGLQGPVLQRLRGVQDREGAGRRPLPEPPEHAAPRRSRRRTTSSGSRRSATGCSRTTRRTPTSSSRRAGATRSSTSSRSGLQDVSITPQGVHLGHPGPVRPRADDLRLVRRAAELHHGDRLRHRRGTVPATLAGRRPRHRQGHHAVPLRLWPAMLMSAGLPLPRQRLRARVRLQQGGEDQQVGRDRDRPDGRLPRSRRRRLPLLLHEGMPVRRRRRLQRGAVRRGLQRRPRQQPGQPLQPRPVDVRQVLRRQARGLVGDRADRLAGRARPRGAGGRPARA